MNNSSNRPGKRLATSTFYDQMVDHVPSRHGSLEEILVSSDKAMKAFTSERLQPFLGKRVTRKAINACASFLAAEETLSAPSLIVRCRIKGPEFKIDVIVDKAISHGRLSGCFVPFLSRLLPRFCGEVEFLMLLSDNLYPTPEAFPELVEHFANVPFLRCDRNDNKPDSHQAILIPDFYIQQSSYGEVFQRITDLQMQFPFAHRERKVMWRGSLSGPTYVTLQNVRAFPRYKLLELSRESPSFIDARLTNYDDDELGRYLLKRFGTSASWMPESAFLPYKYLISLDGAAAAWRRVPMCLIAGSVLLLQHEWSQFFYPGLVPWVHYVPLRKDLTDLIEKYEWLEAHPAEAEAIASFGQAFAMRFLTPEAIEKHFLKVLAFIANSRVD